MTAAWLLPIVATIVAAASGGIVAEVLPNPHHALWTIIVSYVLWGTGVPLAMAVLVIYFQRLTVHKLPPREVIVSVFLPLGPLGQGGFGIMQLGKVASHIFPETHTLAMAGSNAGEILYVMGWLTALIMWGFGIVWLFFALASISRSKFPFNMGWWGFTFPLGVFTVSTTTLGKEIPSMFFEVLGTVRVLFRTSSTNNRLAACDEYLVVMPTDVWVVHRSFPSPSRCSGSSSLAGPYANLRRGIFFSPHA